MPDRKKVIKGVECHRKKVQTKNASSCLMECPYSEPDPNRHWCIRGLMDDIYALLKEQEARVMTLDEVKAFEWDHCYLEEVRLQGKEYRAVCGDYTLTCITWPCVTSMRIQHGDESYGKKWRCWSAKPTDEQRKVVKWE